MRLMLLRHAKAEKAEPGMRDHERPLNQRGCNDAARLGVYLSRHALIPDLTLVSTAQRTRETWQYVARSLPAKPAVNFDGRLYNSTVDGIIAVIKEADHDVSTLLVIGHNPGLHETALRLIASGNVETRERLNEGMPTSGLAVIDFAAASWSKLHPRSGRLDRFITPRSLAATDPA
jgi:phosphohistidine phosphatase